MPKNTLLTYTKTEVTESPRLVIKYDGDSDSPRSWTNLGYFLTLENKYRSPDGTDSPLYSIMKETGEVAESNDDHIKRIKKEAKAQGINTPLILPVYRYEHSGVAYHIGTAGGFDNSNCGFYIVTDESAKEYGVKRNRWPEIIKSELNTYTQWANGEVYRFTLYNKDGEVEDSCCGFYRLDDIKEHLPEEWTGVDLPDYLID